MNPAELQKFLDAARTQGLPDQTIVALLRGRGWPEEEVYRALADHYESRNGSEVPLYKRSGTAKDAFLYLLSFGTLTTWTLALGSIMFTVIDRWIKDPLQPAGYYSYGGYYQIADSLASIIIAFPVYLVVMRFILREVANHPEKLESPVRKWLTYIALLIAAAVVVGDLIFFLTYFLRGELTARFVAKVSVVLVIAGGIFWYYFGALRKPELLTKGADE